MMQKHLSDFLLETGIAPVVRKPRFACRLAILAALLLAASDGLTAESKSSPVDAAKAAAAKAAAEKAAAEKALEEKSAAAAKAAEQAAAAAKAAQEAAAKAKAEADKLAAEKAAAEKAVKDKAEAARVAQETLLAQETFAADKAVEAARKKIADAEKALREKTAAADKAGAAVNPAKAAWDKASAEKAAAEKALADADAAAKADAEKALAGRTEAARNAEEKYQAAQAAARKAADEKKAAQDALAAAKRALPQAIERAAQAKAAAIGGLKPLAGSQWTYEKARHLLFRAGFGGPPEEVARLHEMGLHAAVDHLVDYHQHPDMLPRFDAFPNLRDAPYERRLNEAQRAELSQSRVSFRWNQHHQLRQWWLRRMVETPRPLQEKLALFWHGHFACSYLPAEDSFAMWQQNELFRLRAAGNYGALLRSLIHDPAMLRYLNNHVNFRGAANEDLGREIMELFSMGEGRGYSEQDVAQAARALSGYNFEYHDGTFKFLASRHDTEEKTLFGRKGRFGGDELVDLILQQEPTARHITTKLFRYFVHEDPTSETIDRLAHVLRSHQYELRPLLKNLFLSEEFYSDRAMGNHIKNPVELLVGTCRILGLTQINYGNMDSATTSMGLRLFEPPNVAGWKGGRAWIDANTVLLRYNAVAALVEQADLVAKLQAAGPKETAAVVDYFARAFLAVPLSEPKRQDLIEFLGQLPPPDQWAAQRNALNERLRAMLVAMLSQPEFQVAQARPLVRPVRPV